MEKLKLKTQALKGGGNGNYVLANGKKVPIEHKKYRSQPEHEMCVQFFKFVHDIEPIWTKRMKIFHVANERKCTPQRGAALKALGVTSGVPDYVILTEDGKTYFLEAKAGSNGLTLKQRIFKEDVESMTFKYAVFRTVEEGVRQMQKWGLIKEYS